MLPQGKLQSKVTEGSRFSMAGMFVTPPSPENLAFLQVLIGVIKQNKIILQIKPRKPLAICQADTGQDLTWEESSLF